MLTASVVVKQPVCVATKPSGLTLTKCRHCAGNGFQPTRDHTLAVCVACDGGAWDCVCGNLGATRSHPVHGRPFLFNPGTGLLTVTRGKETEAYTVKEFHPDQLPHSLPTRAFEVVRTTGKRAGEVYRLLMSDKHISCDCAGRAWEATARADWNAYLSGGPQYRTCGCIHADAIVLLVRGGLMDLPFEIPVDQTEGDR